MENPDRDATKPAPNVPSMTQPIVSKSGSFGTSTLDKLILSPWGMVIGVIGYGFAFLCIVNVNKPFFGNLYFLAILLSGVGPLIFLVSFVNLIVTIVKLSKIPVAGVVIIAVLLVALGITYRHQSQKKYQACLQTKQKISVPLQGNSFSEEDEKRLQPLLRQVQQLPC
jgi:hypothetical protein